MDSDDCIELEHSVETTCVKFDSLSDKLVKDGKTAILTTSKWGLNIDRFRCDPIVINLILKKKKFNREGRDNIKTNKYNEEDEIFNDNINKDIAFYCGNEYNFCNYHENFWPDCLKVHWIPVGTFFIINNCGDNGESIITVQEDLWTKA
jgi:hypothetical protein